MPPVARRNLPAAKHAVGANIGNIRDGTAGNLVDSPSMTRIIFRDLPVVSAVERQLALHARDRLLDDEIEELPYLIDEASLGLFGITRQDTLYWALRAPVRAQHDRNAWESHFEILGFHSRDPNAHWAAYDLDLRCEQGDALHCIEVFGRQLVCALHGLHPKAILAFAGHRQAA